ncbi:inositol oxygenase [Syncephalastrum racemosum]|uniref:Inositol oxygenase n=1 Tax=Syncephalastrum racemosum TaxID=13706 RepID=A0A1X2HTB3_SYNRA|nr:inositol oxygenase [Syncephalastrum racemosum]
MNGLYLDERRLTEAAKVTNAWESYVHEKYATPVEFRDYNKALSIQPEVARFYKANHENQTLEHVLAMKKRYGQLDKAWMGVWETLEILNGLVDDSDPDMGDVTQITHALQAAEAARREGLPRWFILTALIHDMGKLLYFFGEQQWTVVGDTFPVGCRFADNIVHREYFANNPDFYDKIYSTEYGIYSPQCGIDNVHLSYGHDEYMYQVCQKYLPPEALFIIRYHSFFACHCDGEYDWIMTDSDREKLEWLKVFMRYDVCSKATPEPDVQELKPFYQALIAEFFPPKIRW